MPRAARPLAWLALAVLALGAGRPVLAASLKAFTFVCPEEVLTLVLRQSVQDAQAKSAASGKRLPIDDVTLTLDPGTKMCLEIRSNMEAVRELAQAHSRSVMKLLEKFLLKGGAQDTIHFVFHVRPEVLPASRTSGPDGTASRDVAVAFTFDEKDIDIELHRGSLLVAAAEPALRRLGLWFLDQHFTKIQVADCLEISAHIHYLIDGIWLSSRGHSIVVRYAFARFPFVPFQLDAGGISTDDHVLRLAGHRD